MNAHDEDGLKKLLRQAVPPVESESGTERDLWPAMLRRLDANSAASGWARFNCAWFDGALLAGLVGLAALVPASIPVFLYCL
jgi:hypothetical protein